MITKRWEETDFYYNSDFEVCYFDVDTNRRMYLPGILKFMMETSIRHILKLGMSYWDTQHLSLTWIFRRGDLAIKQYPTLNETVHVKTFASRVNPFFTQRDYIMLNAKGELIATFSTEWILFNFIKRRPCRIEETMGSLPISPNVIPLDPPTFKIKIEGQLIHNDSYRVRTMDIDFNGHVNNVRYSKWICESIPEDLQASFKLAEYFIEMKNEALLGEDIFIDHYAVTDKELRHVIRNQDSSKIYCLARSTSRN